MGLSGTVEFSAPSDSRVDITMVITTTGYTATDIGCKLLSANFTLLTIGLGSPPISTVTTIKPTAEMGCASTEYKVGSVYTVNEHQDLPGVAPLTLLFPSPPTPGPFPPPPSFGPITGTVSYKDGTFTFTMSTGKYVADTLHYAFCRQTVVLWRGARNVPPARRPLGQKACYPARRPLWLTPKWWRRARPGTPYLS